MAITLVRNTETKCVAKVTATGTITLATILLPATMALTVGGTPTVNINGIMWWVSGGASDSVVVARGGTEIFRLYQNGFLDLAGNGWTDPIGNTADISVTITGTGGCYLQLARQSGYSSKIEPWTHGQHDDEAAVGS